VKDFIKGNKTGGSYERAKLVLYRVQNEAIVVLW